MASAPPNNLITATQTFWQARTGDMPSHEDAREAIANVTAFFGLLSAGDRQSESADWEGAELGRERAALPETDPAEANAL